MTGAPTTYEWVSARFNASPDDAAAIILGIEKTHDGFCTPHDLVKVAESETSPIHADIFGKADEEAAYEYRLEVARRMIRSLRPVVTRVAHEVAFLNIKVQRGEEVVQGYVSTEEVMHNIEYRSYAVSEAKKSLAALRRRYSWIKELAEVWSAIDTATDEREEVNKAV